MIKRKDNESKNTQSSNNGKLKEEINNITYDPIEYDDPPVKDVYYDKEGFLDTQKNRIHFKQSNWYAQFQYYRELLAKQSSNDRGLQNFVKEYECGDVSSIDPMERQT